MANDTPKYFQNLVIYEIYTRNHGPNGTFLDVEADLPRIKSLGVDVVWFMPIHPIGKANKKGDKGSPYSIKDYRNVNPEYGDIEDFKRLVKKAHSIDLKVMIDVVFHHTSHNSLLTINHPDWFVKDKSGKPASTVPEWSDVVDLKFPNRELENYLIENLVFWVNLGIDGFRCDVASLIPLDFWIKARKAVAELKPEFIWLAESVDAKWVAERREQGFSTHSDTELYASFDITYDYDIWPIWHAAVKERVDCKRYVEMFKFQDSIYPQNYIKLRCVENHDRDRIMTLASSRAQALAWTAFQAFNKGAFLIYAGQESAATNNPSLFDIDKIEWGSHEMQDYITKLMLLKKDIAQLEGKFVLLNSNSGIQAGWIHPEGCLYGIFNTEASKGKITVPLDDGVYKDLLGDRSITIKNKITSWQEDAIIFRYNKSFDMEPINSLLLNL
jgi:glycosidase